MRGQRDRARRRGGVETNKANDRVEGKRDCGASREIAAHIGAEREAADGQSNESHDLAEDRFAGLPRYAVLLLGDHGAYLNGCRNASPPLVPGTRNASRLAFRRSATTIWFSPVSRSHWSETL